MNLKVSKQKKDSYQPFGDVTPDAKNLCTEKVILRKINGQWLPEFFGQLSRIDFNRATSILRRGYGRYSRSFALRQRMAKSEDEKVVSPVVGEGTKIDVI